MLQLNFSDQDLEAFARGLMERYENTRLYSQKERDTLRKPKPEPVEGEEAEEEPPAEEGDEEAKMPVFEKDLLFRANEHLDILGKELANYRE